jgi:hypothetical protein
MPDLGQTGVVQGDCVQVAERGIGRSAERIGSSFPYGFLQTLQGDARSYVERPAGRPVQLL